MRNFFRGNNAFSLFMIIILAIMLVRSGGGDSLLNDPLGWLWQRLWMLPGIIIGIALHEWAHAWVAYKLGDSTPKLQGRVSMNPVKHIDPIGLIALLFIGFGWGKPVMVNPYAFKRPRLHNFLVDIAGITLNFIIAFIFMGVMGLCYGYFINNTASDPLVFNIVITVVNNIIWMNLVLMIFNLLPVPPLDGFGIITEAFNLRGKRVYDYIYNAGFPILMLLILFNIPSLVIRPIMLATYQFMHFCMGSVISMPPVEYFI